jgi:Asp-tRNA(Asn)/Glu-tRNA(Gln) amidotransferase A subunit family amidase
VNEYKQEFAKYWRKNKLDFIITPGFGSQACLHGYSETTSLAAAYTFIWNVLGTTVGLMPITVTNPDEEVYESKHIDDMTKKLQ